MNTNFPTGICECCQLPSVECFCPGHEGDCDSQWKELFSGKAIHSERSQTQGYMEVIKEARGEFLEPPVRVSRLIQNDFVTKSTYLGALDIVADLLQRKGFGTLVDKDGTVEVAITSYELNENKCRRFVKYICTPDGADEIMDASFRAAYERRKRG